MKENKYRAWDEDTQDFITWDEYGKPKFKEYPVDFFHTIFFYPDMNKNITLEQYINRKDSKGQECYAGDIITAGGFDGWKIIWHHDGWRMQQGDVSNNIQFIPEHFNIYSNIHDTIMGRGIKRMVKACLDNEAINNND